jgi:phage recombination protein Bet
MSNLAVIDSPQRLSVTRDMAQRFGMETDAFEATLRKTIFPGTGTREEFAAFLLVAKQYNLNPVTREIYAMPKRGGGIIPVVSIDGWVRLANEHPAFDGMDFEAEHDDAKLVSITCKIFRKDRSHPTEVTEYLSECKRDTDPWKMQHRMLRHKAMIQCARYAFGFAGIYDEDEAERFADREHRPVLQSRRAPAPSDMAAIEHKPVLDADPIVAREGEVATPARRAPAPQELAQQVPTQEPEIVWTDVLADYKDATESAQDTDALDAAFSTFISPRENDMPKQIYEMACAIDDQVRGRLE